MKKVIIFSFFILSSALMTSCTADAVTDTAAAPAVHADNETGGQTGPTNPPKP